ncbi:Protein of unknown function (DUF604 [Striga hermonthica]|uniref:Uncharacterized protein n=1 Tax=Striga hermonthica TaxID=68872 RepID=A0A9N7NM50_STRHE|nr:Protein of unknown function (DUF604 [Striga hermonthica]
MKAARRGGQSRLLQQTICHHRPSDWTFSVSWGYSAHVYETVLPRSFLHTPLETFRPWAPGLGPPFYTFNTRLPTQDPCHAPHVFFFKSIKREDGLLVTTYSRARPRGLPPCSDRSADHVRRVRVFSPPHKRVETDRCECCDVVRVDGVDAEIRLRECLTDEIIA